MQALRIKRQYFDQIRNGLKTLEARVGYSNIRSIRPNTQIKFECGQDSFVKTVKAIRNHKTVAEMIISENLAKLLPDTNAQEAEKAYNSIYSPEKVKSLGGMVVIELS